MTEKGKIENKAMEVTQSDINAGAEQILDERYTVVEDAITGAFFQLAKEMEVSHITVAGIIKRAGIVRSTFYNHYKDMPSLIEAMEDKTIENIFSLMKSFHPRGSREICYSFYLSMCNYTSENSFMADVFRRPEGSKFFEKSLKMFHQYAREVLNVKAEGKKGTEEAEEAERAFSYAVAYSIGGVVGILHKWAMDEFDRPPKEIAKILTDVFLGGTLQYFS